MVTPYASGTAEGPLYICPERRPFFRCHFSELVNFTTPREEGGDWRGDGAQLFGERHYILCRRLTFARRACKR
jgi:hypothetical protein